MDELSTIAIAIIIICSFLFEYADATIGMGYGTTLTPMLLLLGLGPKEIVPAVLMSQLVCGLLGGLLHHREGNVDFRMNGGAILKVKNRLNLLGYIHNIRQHTSKHLKIALILAACSIIGTIAAVFVAVNIPKFWLKMYIGCLVLAMGVIVLIFLKKDFAFSWKRITALGLIASFNKGMSGGGYGPVVTSGQILSGVSGKNAIGITTLAEGLTCLVGVITYWLVSDTISWKLAPYIVIGAIFSVPLSAKSVKKLNTKHLKLIIAIVTILLGILTISKTLLSR